MITPAQLITCLQDIGINRESRVLTDWRQRGLLPPLRKIGLGRGKGSIYAWDEDILEQTIAVHWLFERLNRSDEVLLGLWFSGYKICPAKARNAWISHLVHLKKRRQQAASRYKDGFLGLGHSWSRQLRKKSSQDSSFTEAFLSFMRETTEWCYDDYECDDEAYQGLIVEIFDQLKVVPSKELYEITKTVWDVLDIPGITRNTQSIEFIRSIPDQELEYTNNTLALIRQILQHAFELQDSSFQENGPPVVPVYLMMDFVGPFAVKLIVTLNRVYPDLPITRSISTIHNFVKSVELMDISQMDDGTFSVSQRVRSEWQIVRENLIRTWATTLEQLTN